MDLFGFFRRRPPIRDPAALAEFIDQQSAFLAQKGIYEYSRARAGYYAKVLFAEREFQDAADKSRWRAFPLGLAMVTEVVEGILRPYGDRARLLAALRSVALSVFDRYPVPATVGEPTWTEARAELERRIQRLSLHAPKRAFDIPAPFAQSYFDLMPIHEKLRGRDFPTTHNYLKVTLCNIHDEFSKRVDAPALTRALGESAPSEHH